MRLCPSHKKETRDAGDLPAFTEGVKVFGTDVVLLSLDSRGSKWSRGFTAGQSDACGSGLKAGSQGMGCYSLEMMGLAVVEWAQEAGSAEGLHSHKFFSCNRLCKPIFLSNE